MKTPPEGQSFERLSFGRYTSGWGISGCPLFAGSANVSAVPRDPDRFPFRGPMRKAHPVRPASAGETTVRPVSAGIDTEFLPDRFQAFLPRASQCPHLFPKPARAPDIPYPSDRFAIRLYPRARFRCMDSVVCLFDKAFQTVIPRSRAKRGCSQHSMESVS